MLFGKFYTDEQIIEQLKGGGEGREEVLHYLFTKSGWRDSALRLVRSLGGTYHEAEDAIQEAFIVLDSHVRSDQYQQIGGLKSYFLGICRGRWYSNRRSIHRLILSDDPPPPQRMYNEDPESLMLKSEEREHLKIVLDQMDTRCRKLLSMYKLNYSMEEIAQAFNLGTENNARQRVFQCRRKLAKLLAQNPFFNEREL